MRWCWQWNADGAHISNISLELCFTTLYFSRIYVILWDLWRGFYKKKCLYIGNCLLADMCECPLRNIASMEKKMDKRSISNLLVMKKVGFWSLPFYSPPSTVSEALLGNSKPRTGGLICHDKRIFINLQPPPGLTTLPPSLPRPPGPQKSCSQLPPFPQEMNLRYQINPLWNDRMTISPSTWTRRQRHRRKTRQQHDMNTHTHTGAAERKYRAREHTHPASPQPTLLLSPLEYTAFFKSLFFAQWRENAYLPTINTMTRGRLFINGGENEDCECLETMSGAKNKKSIGCHPLNSSSSLALTLTASLLRISMCSLRDSSSFSSFSRSVSSLAWRIFFLRTSIRSAPLPTVVILHRITTVRCHSDQLSNQTESRESSSWMTRIGGRVATSPLTDSAP